MKAFFFKRIEDAGWSTPSPWTKSADLIAILMAVALPWSTTIFGIFAFAWFLILASLVNLAQFRALLRRPQCALPVALFALAIAGMLWSDTPWAMRLHSAGTLAKLLALPLLIYQFERTNCGVKVLLAFFFSCTILLFLSWLNWFDPRTVLFSVRVIGVPVKNWITQGQEFVLCIFGAAALAIITWRAGRPYVSACFGALALVFLLNMVFVVSSRTALISLPVLLLALTFKYIGWRRSVMLYGIFVIALSIIWFASPYLRHRVSSIYQQFESFMDKGQLTSAGLRIEYWSKSLKFIREAPVIGHGTGSIKPLFEKDAVGKSVIDTEIVANPHNQTLHVAIEWGLLGVIFLFAMWIAHLLLFTEFSWIAWLGTLIVVQNIFSSIFNSHLSDFVEGWIYVLGVGVAAGMMLNARKYPLEVPVSDDASLAIEPPSILARK